MSERQIVWLRPPQLRTDATEEGERHATWYELFFDLVFVAAVSQLATALSHEPTASGFLRFAGLFVPIVWAWAGFAFYANRFDTDDVAYRLVTAVAMLAIASLAISVHEVMLGGQGAVAFASSYVVVRACLLALYVRARWHITGAGRQLIDLYLRGFSVGAGLWLVSIAVPGPARYWLWAAGLLIDFFIAPLAWRTLGDSPVSVAHVTDRYGSFFIIVLGESVVAVVAGIVGTHFTTETSIVAVASFVIALSMWWIYFDLVDSSIVGRGLLGLVYVYGHFVLLGGVAAFGAGTKLAIIGAEGSGLQAGARWAIAGGLACFLLALAALHLAAEWATTHDPAFRGRLVVSALAVALAAEGGGLAPALFVGILALAMVVQLVVELRSYPVGAASVWTPPAAVVESGDGVTVV